MRRRPLVWLTASFLIGTGFGLADVAPGMIAWSALALAVCLPLYSWRLWRCGHTAVVRLLMLHLSVLLLSWSLAGRAQRELETAITGLDRAAASSGHTVLRGRVSGVISVREASRGEWRHRFHLRQVELVNRRDTVTMPRLPVYVTWYGPGPDLVGSAAPPLAGEIWELRGNLRRADLSALTPRFYLTSRARQSRALERLSPHDWRTCCQHFRRRAAARLAVGIERHPEHAALIHAMMLGQRGDVTTAMNSIFRHSGTIHVFAISGMHVVVITGLLLFIIAHCGVPRQLRVLPLAPLLALYIWMTGNQPSALRAGLMAVLYLTAPLLGRKPDTPTTLAAAALLLLAVNPLQLRSIGFVLSFVVVSGLVALAPPLARRLRRHLGLERLAVDVDAARLDADSRLWSAARWRQARFRGGVYLSELTAVSVAAWLTSAPLTAIYFGLFSPISLPANLLVVPLSFLVMALASLSLAAYSLASPIGRLLNQLACLCTRAMTAVAARAANVPGGVWQVPPPPIILTVAWYVALVAWARHMTIMDRRDRSDASWMEGVS